MQIFWINWDLTYLDKTKQHTFKLVDLLVLGFYGSVNNKVMSSRSVRSGTVPGQA